MLHGLTCFGQVGNMILRQVLQLYDAPRPATGTGSAIKAEHSTRTTIRTHSDLHRLIFLDRGFGQHPAHFQNRFHGIFCCFQQLLHAGFIQTVGRAALLFKPCQKLIYRIRIVNSGQAAHICCQLRLCLRIQRECCIDQFIVNTNTAIVDLLIEIKLLPDRIGNRKAGKPTVDLHFSFYIALVICLENCPLFRRIYRCVKMRHAVHRFVGYTKVFNESFALRHFLLFNMQRLACICKCRRQRQRAAVNHGAMPAHRRKIVTDGIFRNTVAAENLRIMRAQIL